jgi:hypothetical protein
VNYEQIYHGAQLALFLLPIGSPFALFWVMLAIEGERSQRLIAYPVLAFLIGSIVLTGLCFLLVTVKAV